jgi:hypothetical protein
MRIWVVDPLGAKRIQPAAQRRKCRKLRRHELLPVHRIISQYSASGERAKVKGVWYGIVFPIFATLGSLFVLIGGLTNPQFIIFVVICMIAIIGGLLYGKNAYDDVKL